MDDVDYEVWADFIDEIIQRHHPNPNEVLELACGTGSLSFELEKLGCYRLSATDKSPAMVEKAGEKACKKKSLINFRQMNFLDIDPKHKFDIIVSVFDSVNYLLHEEEVQQMFKQVQKLMNHNSLFIFDFTTPQNSRESIPFLNNKDGKTSNGYQFHRKSRYDADRQIHYNTFEIEKLADDRHTVLERFTEEHKQRTYSLGQMQEIISESDFQIRAQYREFDLDEADEKSLRITMVLQCKKLQNS